MTSQRYWSAALLAIVLAGSACGGVKTSKGVAGASGTGVNANPAPVLIATPAPGPFNGSINVALTTDIPAEILATIDGTDPHVASASRLTATSELDIPLSQTTTVTAFARTEAGVESAVQTLVYTRAGNYVGTVSGEIIYGDVVIGKAIALEMNGQVYQTFPAPTTAGSVAFVVTGLASGTYSFTAVADTLGTGQFLPILDYASAAVSVTLDTTIPSQAAADGVNLYLGASMSGLCTIQGIISVPGAAIGQVVRVSSMSSSALGGLIGSAGGGTGAASTTGLQSLLTQLQNGYQVFALPGTTDYPYADTNLQPGSYVVMPAVTSIGAGGLGIDFMMNPFNPIMCPAGGVVTVNFEFGPDTLGGNDSAPNAAAGTGPLAGLNLGYGIVAARSFGLTKGIQGLLMPTFLLPGGSGGPSGSYSGTGLVDGQTYSERAYTSLDSTSSSNPLSGLLGGLGGGTGAGAGISALTGPILNALLFAINPLSTDAPQVTFTANGNMTENLTQQ